MMPKLGAVVVVPGLALAVEVVEVAAARAAAQATVRPMGNVRVTRVDCFAAMAIGWAPASAMKKPP